METVSARDALNARLSSIYQQFPQISSLTKMKGNLSNDEWGLCQKISGDVGWCTPNWEWQLQIPLSEIYAEVEKKYGEDYDPDEIRFFYVIETSDGKNDILCSLQKIKNVSNVEWIPNYCYTSMTFLM